MADAAQASASAGRACAAGAGNAPVVSVAGLKKHYDDLEAIREVSFAVRDGEFLSVLGPSGCGKSTLLMMIAGITDATGGEIRVLDAKVAGPRREVGVVFQSPVLLPWRTVLQNVLFPIELLRLPRSKYEPRARELLRMVRLEDFAARSPRAGARSLDPADG